MTDKKIKDCKHLGENSNGKVCGNSPIYSQTDYKIIGFMRCELVSNCENKQLHTKTEQLSIAREALSNNKELILYFYGQLAQDGFMPDEEVKKGFYDTTQKILKSTIQALAKIEEMVNE